MKKIYPFIALLVLGSLQVAAQSSGMEAVEQKILKEGLALYESEQASWVATDMLLARNPDMAGVIGYLTYTDQDSVGTIFLQQAPNKQSIAVKYGVRFIRTSIRPATSRIFGARPVSAREEHLFDLRMLVMEELESGKLLKTPYGFPANTRPNVVLLEDDQATRAYVLTGPQEGSILPIGNDFLMSFTSAGKLSKVERLHNSYISMQLPKGSLTIEAGMHTHLPAHPYITATDICSLLLYQQAFPVPQHIVMGPEYVSVFTASERQLSIITKKAFDKMRKSAKN